MENNERLSDAEIEIMNLLWETKKPMKVSEIVKGLANSHTWKTQTAHVLLSRLSAKGYVDADKSGYYHKFFPIVSKEDYLVSESVHLCDKVGRSVPSMVATLITADGISEAELDELTKLLEAKKHELLEKKEG